MREDIPYPMGLFQAGCDFGEGGVVAVVLVGLGFDEAVQVVFRGGFLFLVGEEIVEEVSDGGSFAGAGTFFWFGGGLFGNIINLFVVA